MKFSFSHTTDEATEYAVLTVRAGCIGSCDSIEFVFSFSDSSEYESYDTESTHIYSDYGLKEQAEMMLECIPQLEEYLLGFGIKVNL